jgi:hypothetical protein
MACTRSRSRRLAAAAGAGVLAVALAPLAVQAVEIDDEPADAPAEAPATEVEEVEDGPGARATAAEVVVEPLDAEVRVSDAEAREGEARADTVTAEVGDDVDVRTPGASSQGGEDSSAVVDADAGIATARVLGARALVSDSGSAARAEAAQLTVPLLGDLEVWVLRSDAATSAGASEAETSLAGLRFGDQALIVARSSDGAEGPRSELIRIEDPDGGQSIGEEGGGLCVLGDEPPARLLCAAVSEASTVADLGVELDGTPVADVDLLRSGSTPEAAAELPSTGPEVARSVEAPGSAETARQAGGGSLPRTGASLLGLAGLGAVLGLAGVALRRAGT